MSKITSKSVSSFRSARGARAGTPASTAKSLNVGAKRDARQKAAVSPGTGRQGVAGAPRGRVVSGSVHLRERRARFLVALRELDEAWLETFRETGLSDLYFSRLFTELWLRGTEAVPKTDAYSYVKGVGVQTAMKYVKRAVDEGYLEEVENPADGRSRLIRMSPRLRAAFEALIDRAARAFGM